MTTAELRVFPSAAPAAEKALPMPGKALPRRPVASETLFRWLFYAVSVGWILCDIVFPPDARNWLLWLWASAADRRSSVPEMAYAREDHGEIHLIGCGDHVRIPN